MGLSAIPTAFDTSRKENIPLSLAVLLHNLDSSIVFADGNFNQETKENLSAPTLESFTNEDCAYSVVSLISVKFLCSTFFATACTMATTHEDINQILYNAERENDIKYIDSFILFCFEQEFKRENFSFISSTIHSAATCEYCANRQLCCFETAISLIPRLYEIIGDNNLNDLARLIRKTYYNSKFSSRQVNFKQSTFQKVFLAQKPFKRALYFAGKSEFDLTEEKLPHDLDNDSRLFLSLIYDLDDVKALLQCNELQNLFQIVKIELEFNPRNIIVFAEKRCTVYILAELLVCYLQMFDFGRGIVPQVLLSSIKNGAVEENSAEDRVNFLVGSSSIVSIKTEDIDKSGKRDLWETNGASEDCTLCPNVESNNENPLEDTKKKMRHTIFTGMTKRQQEISVERFRAKSKYDSDLFSSFNDREHNLVEKTECKTDSYGNESGEVIAASLERILVCTSVVEEGLDVPSCNCVIHFDTPSTTRSTLQRNGRARAIKSRVYACRPNDLETIKNLAALEQEIHSVIKRYEEDRLLDISIKSCFTKFQSENWFNNNIETPLSLDVEIFSKMKSAHPLLSRRNFSYSGSYGLLVEFCRTTLDPSSEFQPYLSAKSIIKNGKRQFRARVGLSIETLQRLCDTNGELGKSYLIIHSTMITMKIGDIIMYCHFL